MTQSSLIINMTKSYCLLLLWSLLVLWSSSSLVCSRSSSGHRRHSINNKRLIKKHLNDECLRCICVASSECDGPSVGCTTVGPVDYYCGPFRVSRTYWIKAGSPGYDDDDDDPFGECLLLLVVLY